MSMPPHVIIGAALIVTLVLSLFFLGYCLHNSDKRGAVPLAAMYVGIACWVAVDAMHVLFVETNGNPMAGGGLLVRVLGIELTAIGFLLLGLSYTGRDNLISVPAIVVLLIKPLVVLTLVLSPFRTELFSTVPASVPLGYEIQPTIPFLAHILYSYGIAFSGVALLGSVMLRSPSRYRLQSLALFLAVTIPFTVSVLFQIGVIPFDITPVSFTASGLLLTAGVFRFRLLDTIPIARQRVLDEMDDPVVVLDENDRVVMCNPAGSDLFGDSASLIGQQGVDLFGAQQLETLSSSGQTELWLGSGEDRRRLSVTASPVGNRQTASLATVLVCRDITAQRRRQEQLRSREAELKLFKDLQSRVLRHNLRNELNVVRTNAELLAGEESPEAYEELMEKTDNLLEWSKRARDIERLLDVQERRRCSLSTSLDRALANVRDRYPAVTFETDITDELSVYAVPQIEQAIENVLDNAGRHNTNPDPVVTVRSAVDGDHVSLCIEDNGPGIDREVLDGLVDGDRTVLEDGIGFGLWMVYWVVTKSDGTLQFDTDSEGTTVELRFERAEGSDGVAVPPRAADSA
jgi:signal transduction histidine kinase